MHYLSCRKWEKKVAKGPIVSAYLVHSKSQWRPCWRRIKDSYRVGESPALTEDHIYIFIYSIGESRTYCCSPIFLKCRTPPVCSNIFFILWSIYMIFCRLLRTLLAHSSSRCQLPPAGNKHWRLLHQRISLPPPPRPWLILATVMFVNLFP